MDFNQPTTAPSATPSAVEAPAAAQGSDRAGSEGVAVQSICFVAPIRIMSEMNLREHWRKRHKRAQEQKAAVAWMLASHRAPSAQRISITLTRIGLRRLDKDNLASGMKFVQDRIAKWLGIDDGSDRLDWHYRQEFGKQFALRVLIEWEATP